MSSRCLAFQVFAACWMLSLSALVPERSADKMSTCAAVQTHSELASVLLQTQHVREKLQVPESATHEETVPPWNSVGEPVQAHASWLQPRHGQKSWNASEATVIAPPGWEPHHFQAGEQPSSASQSLRARGSALLSRRSWIQMPDLSMLQTMEGGKPKGGADDTSPKKQHTEDAPKKHASKKLLARKLSRKSNKPPVSQKDSSKPGKRMLSSKKIKQSGKEPKIEKSGKEPKIKQSGKEPKESKNAAKEQKELHTKESKNDAKEQKGGKSSKVVKGAAAHSHKGGPPSSKEDHPGKGKLHLPKMNSTELALKRMSADKKVSGEQQARHKKAQSFSEKMKHRFSMVSSMVSMMVIPVTCFLLATGCLMVYTIDSDVEET